MSTFWVEQQVKALICKVDKLEDCCDSVGVGGSGGGGGVIYTAGTGIAISPTNVISATGSVTGALVSASNGLRVVSASDVQLGGTLSAATTIECAALPLNIQSGSTRKVTINDTTGTNAALVAFANGFTGASISATNGVPLNMTALMAATNTVVPVITVTRSTTGTAAAGIGSSIRLNLMTAEGTGLTSTELISKWLDASITTRVSEFSITGIDSSVVVGTVNTLLTLSGTGAAKLGKYGAGLFTGTPASGRFLAADASGNIIEAVPAGGGGGSETTTASNGLSLVGGVGGDVQLGGTLAGNTVIGLNAFGLTLNGGTTSNTGLTIATSGQGIIVNASGSGALAGISVLSSNTSFTSYGFYAGTTGNSTGIVASSVGNYAADFIRNPSAAANIVPAIRVSRGQSAVNNMGFSIDMQMTTTGTGGNQKVVNQITSTLLVADNPTSVSELSFQVYKNGSLITIMKMDGNGNIVLPQGLPTFADNTAAASLATNTIYKTAAGALMIKF